MVGLALALIVIGAVLLLVGVFVSAAKVLLWVGIALAVVGAVVWLLGGRRTRV